MRLRVGIVRKRNDATECIERTVANDVVVSRGGASLTNLECYCDGARVTTIQADGVIVATSTGSTAYSMSAGGSVMHPAVPALILTPICPHTLSFRPVLLPDTVVLRIEVSKHSRNSCRIAFDGRDEMELNVGDYVEITCSAFPLPTFAKQEGVSEWFSSLARCLQWNVRTEQKEFGAIAALVHDKPQGDDTPEDPKKKRKLSWPREAEKKK
jgi:NAD+ kinase